jgi:hypothetical protein
MRTGVRSVRSLLVGALALMVAGHLGVEEAGAQGSPDAGFPFGVEVPAMSDSGATLEFELVGELGTSDGEGALGRIRDVAVSGDSIVAVLDDFGCMIHLFDLPDGMFSGALGGCGEGPGELLQPVSIAFKGDTLVVSDMGKRRLLYLDGEGEQIRSDTFPSELGDAPIAQIDAHEGLLLWKPHWIGSSPERNMVAVHHRDGRREAGVPDPEVSFTNPDVTRLRTVGNACAFRDAPQVAVSNGWAVELIVLDAALDPIHRHQEVEVTFEPEAVPPEYGGGWTTGFLASSGLACAESIALWAFRRHDPDAREEGRLHVEKAFHFLATADGRILGRRVVEDTAWPDVASQTPAAASGDRFFFYQNSWGPYPTVRIYEVRVGPEGDAVP